MNLEDRVEERMEYWEYQNLRPLKKRTTKIFSETVEKVKWTIQGTMIYESEAVSDSDYQLAVDRFAKAACDLNYLPVDKKRLQQTYLKDFIYNRFAPHLKRPLIFYIENEPTPIVKPKYPAYFEQITNLYLEHIQMDRKFLKEKDLDNLRLVSHKLGNFKKTMNGNLAKGPGLTLPNLFLRHARNVTGDNTEHLTTKFLTFNWVWEKFPLYLTKNGFVERRQNRISFTR